MTTGPSQEPSPHATTAIDENQKRSRLAPLAAGIALILAVGVGILIGYLVFDDETSTSDSDDVATANVDHACALAERLADTYTADDEIDPAEGDSWLWEAPAVGYLLSAAGLQDSRYEDLAERGRENIQYTTQLDIEKWLASIGEIRDECGDL